MSQRLENIKNSTDPNGLDSQSLCIAKYFHCITLTFNILVSNYDVSIIKLHYNQLKYVHIFYVFRSSNPDGVNEFAILSALSIEFIPLFDKLFVIYRIYHSYFNLK